VNENNDLIIDLLCCSMMTVGVVGPEMPEVTFVADPEQLQLPLTEVVSCYS